MYSLVEILSTIVLVTLLYMTAWFVLAVKLKRRDVIDSAWGLGFVLVAWVAYWMRNNDSWVTQAAVLLVTIWGLRLFIHLTTRNWKKKEDYRYKQLGELGSAKLWVRTFFTVFLLQGALMLLISTPVIAIASSTYPLIIPSAILGLSIWAFGIIYEAIADWQLHQFIRQGKHGIMQSGLWKYSRHPNYFGEITCWWGACMVAFAFGQWWGIIGALVITLLLVKISGIPLLEKRYAHDPEYQRYAKHTPSLIPLLVKSRGNS